MEVVVIVGSGQAAFQAAASLRLLEFAGQIVMIGREKGLPYQRPPLSKGVLIGTANAFNLELQHANYFSSNQIDLIDGKSVSEIDRRSKTVKLSAGERIEYSRVILACGARNRIPSWATPEIDGLVFLRSKEEAAEVKRQIDHARHIVIVGAGFIGLECAAAAAGHGRKVNVIEANTRAMGRAVSERIAQHFVRKHIERGVSFIFGDTVTCLRLKGRQVCGVITSSGAELPADFVLVAVGIEPNTELASQTGLQVSNGIVVDMTLHTEDRAIAAIGDCAAFPLGNNLVRLESIQNAIDQGKFIAETILGSTKAYNAVPIFFSEQCGSRLQVAGLAIHSDRAVLRGCSESDSFSVFHFESAKLNCVESVNAPGDHALARKLLRLKVTPGLAEVGDSSFDLRRLVAPG